VPDTRHLEVDCDIYAPCARGATLNDETIPRLKCKAVAGCANNQLLEPRHARELRARGVLYAPDYVINAGGIINVSVELLPGGYDESVSLRKIEGIYDNLRRVFDISRTENIPTNEAAARLAEQRLAAGRTARA
jgi:leucine dehydrogenase